MFLLFAGDNYYPSGGWKDYRGSYASEEDAIAWLADQSFDWWHLVSGGQIVRFGHGD
jgi:hypothetical protein